MNIFNFFRPKNSEDQELLAYSEKIRKTLFPNGRADLEIPGVKIKEVMCDRMTQSECEAFYAAVCTLLAISHLSGQRVNDRIEDVLARTAGVYLDEDELAEIVSIVLKRDSSTYGANAGCSIDKAIPLLSDSAGSFWSPIHSMLDEIFGNQQIDWFMDRKSTVNYRGALYIVIRIRNRKGDFSRVYFEYRKKGPPVSGQ
jgi:hypothetical protein